MAIEEAANKKMHEATEQSKVASRKLADAESKVTAHESSILSNYEAISNRINTTQGSAAKELMDNSKKEFVRAEELKRHAQEELTKVQKQETEFIHKQQEMRHLETEYKSELSQIEAQRHGYEQQKEHLHQIEVNIKDIQARHHRKADADHKRLTAREAELELMLQEVEAKRHKLSEEASAHQRRVASEQREIDKEKVTLSREVSSEVMFCAHLIPFLTPSIQTHVTHIHHDSEIESTLTCRGGSRTLRGKREQ